MKRLPVACCQNDAAQGCMQVTTASSVPWLLLARPTRSSTIARVSGQYFNAQRGIMPPWLWPMIWIFLPLRAKLLRMAATTYSADV